MKKEIGGLVKSQVWEEVPWEPWMKGRLIPTHRIDERKGDKNKTRFVAEGNRTVAGVHYDEVATSMPTQTAVKMVAAFAAGLCQLLFAVDFSQDLSMLPAVVTICKSICLYYLKRCLRANLVRVNTAAKLAD